MAQKGSNLLKKLPAPMQKFFSKDGWKSMASSLLHGKDINWKNALITGTAGVSVLGLGIFGIPKIVPVAVKVIKKIDCVVYVQPSNSYLVVMMPRGKCPTSINKSELGEHLGTGGNKDVYAYGEDKAIGILKPGKPEASIYDEIKLLDKLDKLGFPTVNAELVTVDGKAALMYDRYAQSSKDVVRIEKGKVRLVGESPYLNQQSINDLNKIRNLMVEKNVKIDDLQFMIGKDGRVVISDPLNVIAGGRIKGKRVKPTPNNLKMIDLLIEAAKKNL